MNALQWLILEQRLIEAKNSDEYPFIFLSILQKLLKCNIGISYKKTLKGYIITDAMHVSEIDRQSPTIEWMEKDLLPQLSNEAEVKTIDPPESINFGHQIIHLPISNNGNFEWGVICFINQQPSDGEMIFLKTACAHVAALYSKNFDKTLKSRLKKTLSRKKLLTMLLIVFLLGFIRLPQTVLATAEIMPIEPEMVSPSIDGVIKKINILPNEKINKGQILVELDKILIGNKLEEATQKLKTSKARYLKAYRSAYKDDQVRNELLVLQNEVKQAEIDKNHYTNLLARTSIKATQDGVAIYSSPSDFIGKPVKIGEKIMLIANPKYIKIDFWIPIDNIVKINKEKNLVLYPNLHPLDTVQAQLEYINPIAEPMPDGSLSFFGQAKILKGNIQLGEKGTLKLYGSPKSIWVLIFQRPFRFLRQSLGI